MSAGRVASLAIALSLAAGAHAHQETIIAIASDGAMSKLPPQYQPARLVVSRDKPGAPAVSLTLSGKTVTFPPCIAKLFAVPRGQAIAGLASWYHEARGEQRTLPPYIVLYLRQGTIGEPWNLELGHSLMFDLRTARLAQIEQYRPGKDSPRQAVDAASLCSAEELRRVELRPLFDELRR